MKPILDTNVIYTSPKKVAKPKTPAVANIFGRPMDPSPAPLVYLNGGPGIGKEAVAECLVLLLGQDKSLLVDVLNLGWDDDESAPMTPENPGYFDYKHNTTDYGETRCPEYFSSTSNPASPPCSAKRLASILDRPGNTLRIAILEFCAFDTPDGHAAMSTFAAAARLAGRLFIPIALTCEPAEQMRRAQSLQRQCSYKNRRKVSMPVGGARVGGGRSSSNSLSFGGSVNGGGSGIKSGQPQLPLACPVSPTCSSSRDSGDSGCGEAGSRLNLGAGNGGGVGIATNGYDLTVDITKSSAFETALKVVELVKMLAAERDAFEQRQQLMLLYGRSGSDSGCETDCSSVMMTPPLGGLGDEWKELGDD